MGLKHELGAKCHVWGQSKKVYRHKKFNDIFLFSAISSNLLSASIEIPAHSEDEDSAVLAQLENVIAQKLKKKKDLKKQKPRSSQPDPPDPTLLCVPGKKGHVQRLEKSHQDFKPSEDTDAQVRLTRARSNKKNRPVQTCQVVQMSRFSNLTNSY